MNFCADCGADRNLDPPWMAPDDLWTDISGFGEDGYLCLRCFWKLAWEKDYIMCWIPHVRVLPGSGKVAPFPWEAGA